MGNCENKATNYIEDPKDNQKNTFTTSNQKKEKIDEKYRISLFKSLNTISRTTDFRFGNISIVQSVDGTFLMRKRILFTNERKFALSVETKKVRMKFDTKYFIR